MTDFMTLTVDFLLYACMRTGARNTHIGVSRIELSRKYRVGSFH
jgi:hypothetical protein